MTVPALSTTGAITGGLSGGLSLGSIFSGLGGVASAFGGGGPSGADARGRARSAQEEAYRINTISARNMLSYIREGAEKAGIHPVYALGGSSSQFSQPVVGGYGDGKPSAGERLSRAGAAISRAAEAYAEQRERLTNRLLSAQVKGQELDNAKKASDIVIANTDAPPGMPGSYQFQRNQPVPHRYLPMINPDGSITSVTNPEAGDNEFLMLYDFLTKTFPDEFKNMVRRTYRGQRKRYSKTKRVFPRGHGGGGF
jgi:hypothetical protein